MVDIDDIKSPLINKEIKIEIKKKSDKESGEDNENKEEEDENKSESKKEIIRKIITKNKICGKVYFIFFIQSLIIFSFIYYAFHDENFQKLLKNHPNIMYVSIILASIIMIVSQKVKILTIAPFNYFLFIIFSLSISVIVCKIVILFSFKTIAILWILIMCMIFSLSIYSYYNKEEILLPPTSFITFIILVVVCIIIKFYFIVPFFNMLLIVLCVTSLNIYLIYDVNELIEEKKMSSKDYLVLNILVYLDIIMNLIKLVKFIYKNLSDGKEKNEVLEDIKGYADEFEKGFNEVKNFGEKKDEEEDEDDDEGDKKKKKGKKGKKDDKKGKKGKKEDKKGKKEDKKDKGKKKSKKEDKKNKKKKDSDSEGDIDEKKIKDFLGSLF